jgi:hypothetical protein
VRDSAGRWRGWRGEFDARRLQRRGGQEARSRPHASTGKRYFGLVPSNADGVAANCRVGQVGSLQLGADLGRLSVARVNTADVQWCCHVSAETQR